LMGMGETLIPNDRELEAVRNMMLLREVGHSFQVIADRLNGEGTPAKQGGTWYPKTVRSVLRNPIYEVLL
ncbi:recombinase family protein, partial [Nitrospiraceae bacterium AH_259_D15_M11_P09]|nr:recombinase family protein [Nitrospiraceae bacterium AH_259_D15_M11_P09]